jgi:hypothetical protein
MQYVVINLNKNKEKVIMETNKTQKTEYKNIWCQYSFSPEEMTEIARELAIKTQLVPEIENNAKKAAAQFKEQLLNAKSEQDRAARLYKDGYEMRDIECFVERDFDTGEIKYIRTDTGETARVEKMSMAERQMTIDQAIKKEPDEEKSNEEIAHDGRVAREMTAERSFIS